MTSVQATAGIGSIARTTTRAADYVSLLKPRIIVLLALYGALSALLAGGGQVGADRLVLFVLFASMAAGGAACLNHLFERETDLLMERTRDRPVASGRVSPGAAVLLAAALIGGAVPAAWLTLGWQVALHLALGAGVYGGLYTLVLKRRTPQNIVIGGLAGSHMALAGWAVAAQAPGPGAWLLGALVFLWTPPHFWGLAIARDADYRAAGIPMLPQVVGIRGTALAMTLYAAAVWGISLALPLATPLGWTYGISSGLLGLAFTAGCIRLWQQPSPQLAWQVFKGSGAYLGLLLLAMLADLLIG